MTIYCGIKIDRDVVIENLERIQRQTFRLLPAKEEGQDCLKPLQTLVIEISGLVKIFPDCKELFTLFTKMLGILNDLDEIDFLLFRRCIFECCSLISKIQEDFKDEQIIIIL